MKLLLLVCWGEERLRAWDKILWMSGWIILCPALNSADFKTPQYPHNMHCSDPPSLLFVRKTGEKSWKNNLRSLPGAGAHTCFLSCRRHHLPFYHDSSMMWNSIIKGNCPSSGRGGQEQVLGENLTGAFISCSWTFLPSPQSNREESLLVNQDLIVQGTQHR